MVTTVVVVVMAATAVLVGSITAARAMFRVRPVLPVTAVTVVRAPTA
jgi:hypothetical protein